MWLASYTKTSSLSPSSSHPPLARSLSSGPHISLPPASLAMPSREDPPQSPGVGPAPPAWPHGVPPVGGGVRIVDPPPPAGEEAPIITSSAAAASASYGGDAMGGLHGNVVDGAAAAAAGSWPRHRLRGTTLASTGMGAAPCARPRRGNC